MTNRATSCLIGCILLAGCQGPPPLGDSTDTDGSETSDDGSDGSSDLCGGISPNGECVDGEVHRCVIPYDGTEPHVVIESCEDHQTCDVVDDAAVCVTETACTPGETRCQEGEGVEQCNDQGEWEPGDPCASCAETGIGAFCQPDGATAQYNGTINYEMRFPDEWYADWGEKTTVPATGFLVLSWSDNLLVGSTYTNADGTFSVPVADPPGANDVIAVYAAAIDPSTFEVTFGVAYPDVAPGHYNPGPESFWPGPNAAYWTWSWAPWEYPDGYITITEEAGSGAARVFDYLRYASSLATSYMGWGGKRLVVWLAPETTWALGNAYVGTPATVMGGSVESQIFISGSSYDQVWWSDAVTVHELGHWAMDSFSTTPWEGGDHCSPGSMPPGIVWSEGWATAFSTLVRNEPYYLIKRDGTMAWWRTDTREYGSQAAWYRPDASLGLNQLMDENEISAMLWELYTLGVGLDWQLYALGNPALQGPTFGRGYTTWSWILDGCTAGNLQSTGYASPIFADYLDVLVCNGVAPSIIDEATDPSIHYPYPSWSPICL